LDIGSPVVVRIAAVNENGVGKLSAESSDTSVVITALPSKMAMPTFKRVDY